MAAKQVNPFRSNQGDTVTDEEAEKIETQPQLAPEEKPPPEPAEKPAQPKPEEAQEPSDHVPYDRFQKVTERNQALEKELGELRDFRTRLEERQRVIHEANEQARRYQEQQRRAAERPDPNLDPIGAELFDLRNERQQDRAELEQLRQMTQQSAQTYNTGLEQQQFSNWVTNEANTFAQTEQHYFPAAKHAADWRIGFWKRIAPNAPAGLAEKLVEGESIMIARLAQQYGGKFAPEVMDLARRFGFQPPAGAPNGVPRPRAQSPQQQRLQQVQNGQRLQGLSAVPAGSNSPEGASAYRNYSAADIANMSEREFNACMANPATARDLRYAMARAEGLEGEDVSF